MGTRPILTFVHILPAAGLGLLRSETDGSGSQMQVSGPAFPRDLNFISTPRVNKTSGSLSLKMLTQEVFRWV